MMMAGDDGHDDGAASALPEKFEVFERAMKAADAMGMPAEKVARVTGTIAGAFAPAEEKTKRRRSTPAAKPKDMPEAATKPAERAARPKMIESSWNGRQMWRCPECGDTTFKPHVVNIHVCARPREAKV